MVIEKQEDKKYIFVYQTKNTINGKTYIGVHATNKLNDGYIGCGIKSDASAKSQVRAGRKYPFINAVIKYGYKNFKREVLSFYETQQEAYEEECFLLTIDSVRSNTNYNASLGGFFSKKIPILQENSEEINTMFKKGFTYAEISEKFKKTKGSWIHLIKEDSFKEREKDSFNKNLKIEHLDGTKYTITTLNKLKEDLKLCPKSIYKIKKTGFFKNWYIDGSEKLKSKRNQIKDKTITINNKVFTLYDIYIMGVNKFAKKENINLSTLEIKIKKAKSNG
jgi:hypothetical protein